MTEDAQGPRGAWMDALDEELDYWRDTMRSPPADFLDRLDPQRPFRDLEAVQHLARDGRLRVLDVGAGPLTVLGYTHPACRIELFATDPLAHAYVQLLREAGHAAPVLPLRIEAERLGEVFAEGYFDCAYAFNSLDHCHDPRHALAQMLSVVREGGVVTLVHLEHAGRKEDYAGLHQWDFYAEDGRAWLASRDRSVVQDLAEFAEGRAQLIVCESDSTTGPDGADERTCRFRFRRIAGS